MYWYHGGRLQSAMPNHSQPTWPCLHHTAVMSEVLVWSNLSFVVERQPVITPWQAGCEGQPMSTAWKHLSLWGGVGVRHGTLWNPFKKKTSSCSEALHIETGAVGADPTETSSWCDSFPLVNGSNTREKKREAWIRSRKKRQILCQTGRCIKGQIYLYILVSSSPPELLINMKGWSAGGSVQGNLRTNSIDPSVLEKCQLTRSFRNKQFHGGQ